MSNELKSALAGFGGVAALSLIPALTWTGIALDLDERLFETLAQIGAALLVAYSVEVGRFGNFDLSTKARAQWRGFVIGVGAGGAIAVAVALVALQEIGGASSTFER